MSEQSFVSELLGSNSNDDDRQDCDHSHRSNRLPTLTIYVANTFIVGNPVIYNRTTKIWSLATSSTGCDFIVVNVDDDSNWFDVANVGVYDINQLNLDGRVYVDANSLLTNTVTAQKVGFISNGVITINIS